MKEDIETDIVEWPSDEKDITREMLEKWQNNVLQNAKNILIKNNFLDPITFLLTSRMEIDESLVYLLKDREGNNFVDESIKPTKPVIIALEVNYESSDFLYTMIRFILGDKIEEIAEVGKKMGVKNPSDQIVSAFLNANKFHPKDLVAIGLKHLAKRLNCIALIKVDEIWMSERPITDEGKLEKIAKNGLENDKEAREAISISLQTKSFSKTLVVPFTREVRNTGKVIGFDKIRELDGVVSGRFMNLLKDDKKKEVPITHS